MTEGSTAATSAPPSAGRLLKEAREKQGLHVAALAAAIKVTQKKLELLESDRFDELPDATFARALAQTVCRALKIDSAEIMRLLPPPSGHRLEHVGEGLNTPFRGRAGSSVQRDGPSLARNPAFWIVGLILVAAASIYFLPSRWLGAAGGASIRGASPAAPASTEAFPPPEGPAGGGSEASAGSAGSTTPGPISPASSPAIPAVASPPPALAASPVDIASTAEAPASETVAALPAVVQPPSGIIMLRTTAASWVEVTDGRGAALVARLLQPGEALGLDGPAPFRVRIGNAAGTSLAFRGQTMDLAAYTRDNVARLELK